MAMLGNIGDGRSANARTTFTVTIAWLVGVIMAATYMNLRDAGAGATDVANATGPHHVASIESSTHGARIAHAFDPSGRSDRDRRTANVYSHGSSRRLRSGTAVSPCR